jgi:hypothetical protein
MTDFLCVTSTGAHIRAQLVDIGSYRGPFVVMTAPDFRAEYHAADLAAGTLPLCLNIDTGEHIPAPHMDAMRQWIARHMAAN